MVIIMAWSVKVFSSYGSITVETKERMNCSEGTSLLTPPPKKEEADNECLVANSHINLYPR